MGLGEAIPYDREALPHARTDRLWRNLRDRRKVIDYFYHAWHRSHDLQHAIVLLREYIAMENNFPVMSHHTDSGQWRNGAPQIHPNCARERLIGALAAREPRSRTGGSILISIRQPLSGVLRARLELAHGVAAPGAKGRSPLPPVVWIEQINQGDNESEAADPRNCRFCRRVHDSFLGCVDAVASIVIRELDAMKSSRRLHDGARDPMQNDV